MTNLVLVSPEIVTDEIITPEIVSPETEISVKKKTWKSLIMETVVSNFGDKEFKKSELVKALKDEAETLFPNNKNINSSVGNNLSKLKNSGFLISTRRGYYQAK